MTDTFEPELAVIVDARFASVTKQEKIHKFLKFKFDKEIKHQVVQSRGVSGFYINSRFFEFYEDVDSGGFECCSVVVSQGVGSILDILSVSVLSEFQTSKVLNGEIKIDDLLGFHERVFSELPIFEGYGAESRKSRVFYVRSNEVLGDFYDAENVFHKNIECVLKKFQSEFGRFRFSSQNSVSIAKISSNKYPDALVSPVVGSDLDSLSIIDYALIAKPCLEIKDNPGFLISVVNEFDLVVSIFRCKSWLEHRISEISGIDVQMKNLLELDFVQMSFEELSEQERIISNAELEWLKLSRAFEDEMAGMKSSIPFLQDEYEYLVGDYDYPVDLDFGLKDSSLQPISVIQRHVDHIRGRLRYSLDLHDRTNKKIVLLNEVCQKRLSSEINRSVWALTDEMAKMTKVILGLTVVSAIVACASLYIAYAGSADDKEVSADVRSSEAE